MWEEKLSAFRDAASHKLKNIRGKTELGHSAGRRGSVTLPGVEGRGTVFGLGAGRGG